MIILRKRGIFAKKISMAKYIYQHENWTNFVWNEDKIRDLFGEVKYLQGKLNGIMNTIGFSKRRNLT